MTVPVSTRPAPTDHPPGTPRARPPAPRLGWTPRVTGWARWLPALATLACIAGVIVVTLWQLHPNLLVQNSTETGGDTGAHVMMPRYLLTLLGHGQLTGWDPSWYDGYPIYTFYFVVPDLLAALAGKVIAYNVAFKLVTVLGSLALPVAAWACGRLFGLRRPVPAVLAAATLPFLFDYTFTIYGGNLFSTLAGEYAYSLSLSVALVFLGLFARGLRTGRGRGWSAVVLALCILCHIIPAMFALAGAAILTLFEVMPGRRWLWEPPPAPGPRPRRLVVSERAAIESERGPRPRPAVLWWSASTVAVGVALSGWWLVPFGLRQPYTTSMGYQKLTDYFLLLFPAADRWVLFIAGVAALWALVSRNRFGILIGVLGGVSALTVIFDPQGRLYNVRFLPLWFFCVYLLAGWGFAALAVAVARRWRRLRLAHWVRAQRDEVPGRWLRPPAPRVAPGALGAPLVALFGVLAVVIPPFVVPAAALPTPPGANQISVWANWNLSGYENKPAYPEYRGLNQTMATVGGRYGCGRAMWEYNADLNRFGTTMAQMLLHYWTHGCIDSMEGLLFESSTTTPFHFLNQAELSTAPSNPMFGLPYSSLDVGLGVEHLQLLGVKYFMAETPQVQRAALADPALRLVAKSGPWTALYNAKELSTTWDIFMVRDAAVVTALANQPAVLTGLDPSQPSWLGTATPQGLPIDGPAVRWYQDPGRWNVELAADGPAGWPRIPAGISTPPVVPVAKTTVSAIHQGDASIRFHVDRLGTPVLVKISYFPNWHAHGASGPWRVTPNLMVVVPTSHEVTLTYGATAANRLGELLSLGGALALVAPAVWVWVRRRGHRAHPH
jgi:hypothetical protein